MSILLIVEVMDWAPPALTHREHKVLIILAEDCRETTRETWRPIDSPDMLRRARLARWEMYAVIKALIKKGCLERSVAGGFHHQAKYKILPLAPLVSVGKNQTQQSREIPDAESREIPDTEHVAPDLRKDDVSAGRASVGKSLTPTLHLQNPSELSPVEADLRNGVQVGAATADGENTRTRAGTERKRQRLADELHQWMREHPEAEAAP